MRKQAFLFILAKKSVKQVSRAFATGDLQNRILSPSVVNNEYDESTGAFPMFKGFAPATLLTQAELPDAAATKPKREVVFVGFDLTEWEGLETVYKPEAGNAEAVKQFWNHVHDRSVELEKFLSMVRRVGKKS